MQDNRWCDWCGSDRTTKKVRWYDCDGTELSFCGKCLAEVRASDEYVRITYLPQLSD